MSLNSILNIASSGLGASQAGIRTVSQNISNVNTPGYVRLEQDQTAINLAGRSSGVEAGTVRRAADRFLQAAALRANANAGQSEAIMNHLDRVQASFGDPTSETSIFASMDRALGAFESAIMDPGSVAGRRQALSYVESFTSQLSGVKAELDNVRASAQSEIMGQVDQINTKLAQFVALNGEISRARMTGDATGAEQRLSDLADQISAQIDVRLTQTPDGTFELRTNSGQLLAGHEAGKISVDQPGLSAPNYGRLQIAIGNGSAHELEPYLQSGSLKGLIDLRDKELGAIGQSLGEFAGKFADAINSAHNQSATIPAVNPALGRDTGLMGADSLGFTGQTSMAIVNADGTLARRIDINFDSGQISVNGTVTGATGGTLASFTSALNTAIAPLGTAQFTNGKMSLSATASAQGFAFQDSDTNPSTRGGRGFAQFFGLNDLIQSSAPTSFATGLNIADNLGFAAGSVMTMRLVGANGEVFADKDITMPAVGTVNDMLNTLNDNVAGFGMYGGVTFSNDGTMRWAPDSAYAGARLEMVQDVGPRGTSGVSFGQLFGLSPQAREGRAAGLIVNPVIKADPRKLGFAQLQLADNPAVGDLVVGMADSRGAQALGAVAGSQFNFTPALGASPVTRSLADYAAALGGDIATRAQSAQVAVDNANALKAEAGGRRANVEGVNLDEELVKLTNYQQAYAASARMLTAANEMYDTLLRAI